MRASPPPLSVPSPQRILIVLLGAIGDVTRALPLLMRVRRAYPDSHIAWAVEPAAAPLLDYHPALNDVLVYHRARGLRAFVPFLRAVRGQDFDLVLDLQRHAKSGLVSWWSAAPLRLGFHPTNTKEGNWLFNTHTIEPVADFSLKLGQYLKFAERLGLQEDAGTPAVEFGLRLRPEEEQRVERLLGDTPQPFAAFFLGSRWPSRFWFPESTAQVARALVTKHGLRVVLLGGPDETAFARTVRQAGGPGVTDLSGQTSLRDLIGIFTRCRLAFGPDSGPMHIAAASGAPVVSLWGATSPVRSAPWGSKQWVITGPAACSPCYARQCRIGRRCMQRIRPAQVLEVIERVLGS